MALPKVTARCFYCDTLIPNDRDAVLGPYGVIECRPCRRYRMERTGGIPLTHPDAR